MKQAYSKPAFRVFGHVGALSNDEIAALDDDALAAYLRASGLVMQRKRYQIDQERYIYREIAGENVLVPIGTLSGNEMVVLNDTSAFLTRLFLHPNTIEQAMAEARAAYDDPAGEIEQHVFSFVEQYLRAGMIREAE